VDVVVAGGAGKIGLRLLRLLHQNGHRARGLIRKEEQSAALRSAGAEPALVDLESVSVTDLAIAIKGADSIVFAAGAGPGSGAQRKLTVDRDGAIKLLAAARSAAVERYVMVSSIGAEQPPDGDDVFSVYLRAKAQADAAVAASDRAWTIVRPGSLTDEPGTGRVRLTADPVRGDVSRDDVAAVLAEVLHEPRSVRQTFYVVAGDDPVPEALAALLG
jgi:uncharacterized protein YbjT (DUF2867 family)